MERFIRASIDTQTKFIGICFGHQVLARALGGTVVKSEKGYGIGVMDYHSSGGSARKNVSLCAWHQDQVVTPPDKSRIILSSGFCPIAGLLYGGQAISLQPHPEFTKEFASDLITFRTGETITPVIADQARASMRKDIHTEFAVNMLTRFCNGQGLEPA